MTQFVIVNDTDALNCDTSNRFLITYSNEGELHQGAALVGGRLGRTLLPKDDNTFKLNIGDLSRLRDACSMAIYKKRGAGIRTDDYPPVQQTMAAFRRGKETCEYELVYDTTEIAHDTGRPKNWRNVIRYATQSDLVNIISLCEENLLRMEVKHGMPEKRLRVRLVDAITGAGESEFLARKIAQVVIDAKNEEQAQ